MEKKEQTNGGSRLSIVIGEFETDNEKNITMPPEKSKKLSIASIARMKELEDNGYLEINVGHHEAFKDGDKIVKRIVDGKEIAYDSKKTKKLSKKSNDTLESR